MINKELLKKCIDEKLVVKQKHPELDLYIYNYTNECQYSKSWNEVTLKTRGLVLDSEMNIVSKSFNKFFNISEHLPEEIPNLSFEVFEKMDGSLLLLFNYNNQWIVASKGSFTSDQAVKGQEFIKQYNLDLLDKNNTYCFEIIYKTNRIVVDYGDFEGLILLACFNNKTGEEMSYDNLLNLEQFKIVKRYDGINDINKLKELEEPNKEGFVNRFSNGFRCKSKFDEYVRLHRIVTGVSNITIWEYLSQGKPFDELLSKVPDEFYDWVKKTKENLLEEYDIIETKSKIVYKDLISQFPILMPFNEKRKLFATEVMTNYRNISGVLFHMLDGKDYSKIIWKEIRPKFSKPFALNKEEI